MAKPWARIEIGRMRHPKFLALTGNAIALWDEGKEFCDDCQTEGFIPLEALKTFRFRAPRSVDLLCQSIGRRVGGEAYAPLWEPADGGYQMHDYLSYNDTRTEVLGRLQDAEDRAELRQAANLTRQREYRAARKAELTALRNGVTDSVTDSVTAPLRTALRTPLRNATSSRPPYPDPDPQEERVERDARARGLEDEGVSLRAGRLVERYGVLFCELRHGAKYHPKPNLDWQDACGLCRTWADDLHLEQLARIVLMTDDPFISRTDRSFHIFAIKASWADDRLRAVEREAG